MWTCNRLDLQTPGSQPVMPKNLPDHLASREVSSGKYQKFGTRISHQVPNGYPPEREGDPQDGERELLYMSEPLIHRTNETWRLV